MPANSQVKFQQILQQIASLQPMRKGSITMQTVETTKKDGSKAIRGPYPLYTCKKKGRTVSRRIPKDQVDTYRTQIERHHQFKNLIDELSELYERMADIELREGEEKKGS